MSAADHMCLLLSFRLFLKSLQVGICFGEGIPEEARHKSTRPVSRPLSSQSHRVRNTHSQPSFVPKGSQFTFISEEFHSMQQID